MRRAASLILILASGGLMASCSGSSTGLFPKFGLYFNQDAQGANLAYGEANSDNVGLMLQCDKGSGQVRLTDVAATQPADRLILASGAQRLDVPVRLSQDESGAALAEASIPASDPVMQGFRRSGVMAVKLGASRYGVKARAGEQGAVNQFFAVCS